MSSPFATPKKLATDEVLHPPGSAIGIARAAANEAKGKAEIDDVQALTLTLTLMLTLTQSLVHLKIELYLKP